MFAGTGAYTLRDIAAQLTPDRTKLESDIINLVAKSNRMLDELPIVEANDGSSNKTTYRTAMPTAQWTAFREGVISSKGGVTSVRNTAGHLETKLEISQREYDIAPDKNAFLAGEVEEHIEAMNQEMAQMLIYGKLSDQVRGFNGIMAHHAGYGYAIGGKMGAAACSDDTRPQYTLMNGGGTLTLGGAGANGDKPVTAIQTDEALKENTNLRSILLVGFGNKTVRGFYPKGTRAGIEKGRFKDHIELLDDNGGTYEGCVQHLSWDMGLDLRDWRYVGRIANLDVTQLEKEGAERAYIETLRKLTLRVRSDGARQALFMCRSVWEAVQTWFARKTLANAIQYTQIYENLQPTLWGIRVVLSDAMNRAEEALPMLVE